MHFLWKIVSFFKKAFVFYRKCWAFFKRYRFFLKNVEVFFKGHRFFTAKAELFNKRSIFFRKCWALLKIHFLMVFFLIGQKGSLFSAIGITEKIMNWYYFVLKILETREWLKTLLLPYSRFYSIFFNKEKI